jgi:N-glycosylase/DNA lyase
MMMPENTQAVRELKKLYGTIQNDIDERLHEFKLMYQNGSDAVLFREMCFCMCTPQNNAQKAWGAALALEKSGLLYNGNAAQIAKILRDGGVRFHNTKAKAIAHNAKQFYPDTKKHLQKFFTGHSISETRNELANITRGWGLKEASHFLRNIGVTENGICILDRHILRQLVLYDVIPSIPDTLSKNKYLNIETAMLAFAKKAHIPADALDLLFWYKAKGEIFK